MVAVSLLLVPGVVVALLGVPVGQRGWVQLRPLDPPLPVQSRIWNRSDHVLPTAVGGG